jgi:hypothetical protein
MWTLLFGPLPELLNRSIGHYDSTCRHVNSAGAWDIQSSSAGELGSGRETCMLWTVFAILLLLWLLGWGFHVAGSLIHLILVIALVVLVIELITGRRATV